MKNIYLCTALLALCACLAGCGMIGANVNVNTNAPSNTNATKPAEAAPANAAVPNTNANANANIAATKGPKRISFGKGSDWGTESATIPAGGSAQFVVGAKKGQLMDIEASSGDVKVFLITKGKGSAEEHPNGIGVDLKADGDYVFEVRNLSKKEVKTSVKVTIADGDAEGDY